MKKLLLTVLLSTPAFAGELYQHFQLPLLDAYVDSTVHRESDIPGLGRTGHSISISLTTTDSQTSFFAVYLKVQMDDGTQRPILANLYRESDGPTTGTFHVGQSKPLKIVEFYVVRLRPESADHLIRHN